MDLDDFVVSEDYGMLGDCEVSVDGCTTEDLEKGGHVWREILNAVEHPLHETTLLTEASLGYD